MEKSLTRRDFFKKTIAGVGGYVLLDQPRSGSNLQNTKKPKFVYRTLGKTGIKLPVISMGVMNADNPSLVKAALEAGIVHLDTAWSYQRGRNEEMIGSIIKDYPRDSYVIATKVPGRGLDRSSGKFTEATKAEDFLEKFDQSLDRLGLEYVDILYLHNIWTRDATLFEPLMKAMASVKKEGKARFIGVSTHRNEAEVIRAVIDSQFYDTVLTAYNFKQAHHQELAKVISTAADQGIGIVAMKPLAGGYLDEERNKPVDVKAALKWILQNKNVTTIIPGCTTFEQLETDLSVMDDITFTEKDKQTLELGSSDNSIYCQGCETCLKQCPQGLPIPDLMRAYMYAYAYRNYWEARELLSTLNIKPHSCHDCYACQVRCAKGFDIKQKLAEVVSLKAVPEHFFG